MLIAYVTVWEYGWTYWNKEEGNNPADPTRDVTNFWDPKSRFPGTDTLICVWIFGYFLNEVGGFTGNSMEIDSYNQKSDNNGEVFLLTRLFSRFYDNFFNDVWNFFDLLSISFTIIWIICHFDESLSTTGRGFLAVAAIPSSLSMLRYLSIEKEMGNLVITVVSMSKDLFSFLMVYIVSIVGFGITFKGLFQHDFKADPDINYSYVEGFSTNSATLLALIDGSLGNYSFAAFDNENPYMELGIVIMIIFLILTAIILLNLLIAKMSSTYAAREEKAIQEWQLQRAKITKQFGLIGEASTLAMLPAPLNIIPAIFSIPHWLYINKILWNVYWPFSVPPGWAPNIKESRNGAKRVISVCGTISDWLLGLLSGVVMCTAEIFFDVLKLVDDFCEGWKQEHDENYLKHYTVYKDSSHSYSIDTTIQNIWWALQLILHVILYIMISPLVWLYYFVMHIQEISSHEVLLEFRKADSHNLRIVYQYPKDFGDGGSTTAKFVQPHFALNKDCLNGKIIRGKVRQYGAAFNNSIDIFVRFVSDPFSSKTGNATIEEAEPKAVPDRNAKELFDHLIEKSNSTSARYTNKKENDDNSNPTKQPTSGKIKNNDNTNRLEIHEKEIKSFANPKIIMPLFPFGRKSINEKNGQHQHQGLMNNLKVQLVSRGTTRDSEKVIAQYTYKDIELRQMIMNGRFEGDIPLFKPEHEATEETKEQSDKIDEIYKENNTVEKMKKVIEQFKDMLKEHKKELKDHKKGLISLTHVNKLTKILEDEKLRQVFREEEKNNEDETLEFYTQWKQEKLKIGHVQVAIYFQFDTFDRLLDNVLSKCDLVQDTSSITPSAKYDSLGSSKGSLNRSYSSSSRISPLDGDIDDDNDDYHKDKGLNNRFDYNWSRFMMPYHLFTTQEKRDVFEIVSMMALSKEDSKFESVKNTVKHCNEIMEKVINEANNELRSEFGKIMGDTKALKGYAVKNYGLNKSMTQTMLAKRGSISTIL
jgi:hypothetical protein